MNIAFNPHQTKLTIKLGSRWSHISAGSVSVRDRCSFRFTTRSSREAVSTQFQGNNNDSNNTFQIYARSLVRSNLQQSVPRNRRYRWMRHGVHGGRDRRANCGDSNSRGGGCNCPICRRDDVGVSQDGHNRWRHVPSSENDLVCAQCGGGILGCPRSVHHRETRRDLWPYAPAVCNWCGVANDGH